MSPVDRAGPVCRDEFLPGFTWSEPAVGTSELALAPRQDMARKLWRAVFLLAWLTGLARAGERDYMEKTQPC